MQCIPRAWPSFAFRLVFISIGVAIVWTGTMLENPIILAALICFLLGLVLSGLVRLVRSSAIESTVLPIIFLTS